MSEPNQDITTGADPHIGEQTQFKAELDAVTREIEAEFAQAKRAEYEEEVAPEGEPHAPSGPDASPPDPQVVPSDSEEDDPGVARGLDRLVARELDIRAKESAIAAREAKLKEMETEYSGMRGLKDTQTLREQLKHSASSVIEALGGNPSDVIRLMLAEQLGDKAPPELKEFAKEAAYNRRVAALEAQLQAKQHAEERVSYFRGIELGAREYVKTVGEKDMPTLAALSRVAPDRAHSEIMEEIARDARARAQQEPDGEPLTYATAAKRVEDRLSALRLVFSPAPDTKAPTQKQAEAKKATPPLTRPDQPKYPWARRDDDLYESGLREAMREFNVHEAKTRALGR